MIENAIKFLQGKYNLVFSYWVISVLSTIVVGIPLFLVGSGDVDNYSTFATILIIAYYVFFILYSCGALIGTWRSSTFYIQDKINSKQSSFWGYASRVGLILGWGSIGNEIIKLFK